MSPRVNPWLGFFKEREPETDETPMKELEAPMATKRTPRPPVISELTTVVQEVIPVKNEVIVSNGEHSKEWWEGNGFLGPKMMNPYLPSGTIQQIADWREGWERRFFGENP